MINDIKHLLMGLFAIYVSYLQCLFQSFECCIYSYYCCFWLCCMACRILVPQPRVEPAPPGVEVWHPNHWTTRAFPEHVKIGLFSYWVLRILCKLLLNMWFANMFSYSMTCLFNGMLKSTEILVASLSGFGIRIPWDHAVGKGRI